MKKFFAKYSYLILVAVLLSAGAFLRLYNFSDRVIYGPEQGISLLTSAANLKQFSLLGEYNLQRFTSAGLNLIHGPLFSYFLLPFIVLFNFRVLPVSLVFVFLNLLSGLLLFLIARKFFGKLVAVLALFFFLFSALMIYHSLFIWIYHPLILFGVLSIWFVGVLKQSPARIAPVFWLGLLSGIGFSLQYPYLLTAGFLFLLCLLLSKKKIRCAIIFFLSFVLANGTRVVFDLRHDFYHLRTLWQYFLDVYIDKTISGELYSYHFLQFFPLFSLLLALLSAGIYHLKRPLLFLPIAAFLFINLTSPLLDLDRSLGMPGGITLSSLEKAASSIAADKPPQSFNVATLWDFDTLARPMRYLLTYYYGLTPQGPADYPNAEALYVFAPESYDLANPKVWELRSFLPYKIKHLPSPSPGYRLVKLIK